MKIGELALALGATSLSLAAAAPNQKRASSFKWFGVNQSIAEFGQGNIPGELDTDYRWPDTSAIQVLKDDGMNIFRVAFLMERLIPEQLTGSFDDTYLADLKSTVEFITSSGSYAILDPHNYGRYYGNIITSTSDFGAWWTTVANEFKNNDKVIFDTNNEYHSMDQDLVLRLNQASIDAIRATGATQYIFVEGNSWTGAWTWTQINDNMKALTDPQNKIVYEMHQYLDSDGSGTHESCVSTTIGQERVASATQWLKDNGKVGFMGEFAGGPNSVCQSAVDGLLSYMHANSDVWLGASWWAAGPWWKNYMFSMEPPTGTGYINYIDALKPYFPDGSDSGPDPEPEPTATTTPTVPDPTPTNGNGGAKAKQWEQCGGIDYMGPTECESPWTCQVLNDWYFQCL
ncbi:hypothetical protein AJ80_08558 [Polytolypa hystricis UAMH7299]|uniref:cellulase n=1 Tax=Polytolypa hystricis (strain UAMH7299) TaxID=1447883 RepID=A0A2B7X604_POLH7|nr:hypothetical protein AJ80_08558 [Polytolypa hystricis UAMH7299]